jgi:hypothetical protein
VGRRRDGNHSPQKKNLIQNSVGNEENGYPDSDINKTMINATKEISDAHKKTLKKEIWAEISEKLMEKISDKVNQNVQHPLKKPKTKKTR